MNDPSDAFEFSDPSGASSAPTPNILGNSNKDLFQSQQSSRTTLNSNKLTFKVYYNKELKRITIEKENSYEELIKKAIKYFQLESYQEIFILASEDNKEMPLRYINN